MAGLNEMLIAKALQDPLQPLVQDALIREKTAHEDQAYARNQLAALAASNRKFSQESQLQSARFQNALDLEKQREANSAALQAAHQDFLTARDDRQNEFHLADRMIQRMWDQSADSAKFERELTRSKILRDDAIKNQILLKYGVQVKEGETPEEAIARAKEKEKRGNTLQLKSVWQTFNQQREILKRGVEEHTAQALAQQNKTALQSALIATKLPINPAYGDDPQNYLRALSKSNPAKAQAFAQAFDAAKQEHPLAEFYDSKKDALLAEQQRNVNMLGLGFEKLLQSKSYADFDPNEVFGSQDAAKPSALVPKNGLLTPTELGIQKIKENSSEPKSVPKKSDKSFGDIPKNVLDTLASIYARGQSAVEGLRGGSFDAQLGPLGIRRDDGGLPKLYLGTTSTGNMYPDRQVPAPYFEAGVQDMEPADVNLPRLQPDFAPEGLSIPEDILSSLRKQ